MLVENNESIKLDPSPNAQNDLVLIVSRKEANNDFEHPIRTVQIGTSPGFTVQRFLDFLDETKHINFEFSETGQGCRYWLSTVIASLHSNKLATDGVDEFQSTVETVWSSNGTMAPIEMQTAVIPGTFLDL
jgi:hypothetical protein